MDWYIFLTPLLLLPIIFLFRLVGCTLDFDQFQVGRPPTYNLEGPDPSEGEVDVESENFTVSLLSGEGDGDAQRRRRRRNVRSDGPVPVKLGHPVCYVHLQAGFGRTKNDRNRKRRRGDRPPAHPLQFLPIDKHNFQTRYTKRHSNKSG